MMTAKFTCTDNEESQSITIRMDASYKTPDWEALEKFCKVKIAEGIKFIVVDLSAVMMIDSRFLGQLVGVNTRLLINQGHLTVIVMPGSKVENIFKLTKLDQILKVEKFKPVQSTGKEEAALEEEAKEASGAALE